MASDLYLFDASLFSDPFSPFTDSSIDILQAISIPENNDNNTILQNPVDETHYFDQIATTFSSSPPSHQLENLSLCQTQTTHFLEVPNSAKPIADFSCLEVKTEESQVPLPSPYVPDHSFGPHNYGGSENVVKMMQKSFTINSFEGKPSLLFQPQFDTLMESPGFQPQAPSSSSENSYSSGQMRRVCSTGDLQNIKITQMNQRLSSSPLSAESSFIEEANLKVGRYSAEERRERIHRYRAKRTHRNFNKTIKYACRKTLADNRPRIRGRFARNDETGQIPKTATFQRYEDENDVWIDGLNEADEQRTVGGGLFINMASGPARLQYYGY